LEETEMIMGKYRIAGGMTVAAVLLFFVHSVVGEEYPRFFFAEEPINPRTTAMGCAGAALDGGGFSFYNPASIALAGSPFVGMEFGQQGGGLSKSLIETAWMFPSWFVGIAMPVQSNDWQIGTEQEMGAISSNQMFGPTIAGGYLRGPFALGGAIMALNERIGDFAMHAVTFNTGVTWRIIPGSLTAGASAYHFIRFDTLRTPWTKIPRGWYRSAKGLPRMVRAGVAWNDTVSSGIPYTVAADLLYRDIDGRLIVPIGIEAWVLPSIAVRMGKKLFDRRGDLLHMGCGLRWSSLAFNFDYALDRPPVSGADLEPKWLFGLTYSVKSPAAIRIEEQKTPLAEEKQAPAPVEKPFAPVIHQPASQDSSKNSVLDEPQVQPAAPADTAAAPSLLPEETAPRIGASPATDSLFVPPSSVSPADTVKPH
jgi:hypothetical protein